MTDYIKEFGNGQEGKKFIPAKIKRPVEPPLNPRKDLSLNEETITINEVKELATNLVLELMNADIQPPTNNELLSEQKSEIEQKIEECCLRSGILSLTYHDNFDLNESSIGAMVDPTNTKNWVLLKEEQVYKLPYSYKNALHTFAAEVWRKNRDLILEIEDGTEVGIEYINQLKQTVKDANAAADARYNEISRQPTGYSQGNIFQPTITHSPDAREGHRIALADGQYRLLKKRAIDLEVKLRRLEKRVKKI